MNVLTPAQAALVADAVYTLTESNVSEAVKGLKKSERDAFRNALSMDGMFPISDSSRFEGSTGMIYRHLSGFGYIVAGQGRYQGDVLIVTRGTTLPIDWLTNANVSVQTGPSGHLVHGGFNQTWKSISQEIRSFLRGRNPTTLHCVGHSLGGALATLNAAHLAHAGVGGVKLYTFGQPRVGLHGFNNDLTRRLGAANIYRLAHPCDPVPMIWLFPFGHAPTANPGLTIPSGGRGISKAAHSMAHSYKPICTDKDWSAFEFPARASAQEDGAIQAWLDNPTSLPGLRAMSAELLSLTGRALRWILKKAGELVAAGIGTVGTVAATVLDQLAWLLSQGVSLSAQFGRWVGTLVQAILKFLGRTVSAGVDLTRAFLRWVLDLLFSTLSALAAGAVSLVGR